MPKSGSFLASERFVSRPSIPTRGSLWFAKTLVICGVLGCDANSTRDQPEATKLSGARGAPEFQSSVALTIIRSPSSEKKRYMAINSATSLGQGAYLLTVHGIESYVTIEGEAPARGPAEHAISLLSVRRVYPRNRKLAETPWFLAIRRSLGTLRQSVFGSVRSGTSSRAGAANKGSIQLRALPFGKRAR